MTDLSIRTIHGGDALIEDKEIQQFASSLRGPLLRPGDAGYDHARVIWNGMIDQRPALIAGCTGAADVMTAIRFAGEHEALISIKGGGHNVSGKAVCAGGLMLDLSRMKSIRVEPASRSVRAEPGVIGAELDREAQAFGLATPVGTVSTTGIAGLTLGGGQSWLASKHGMAIDNLRSVDLVTADGQLRNVSAIENQDLFWAVRGAGHNFGVVTSFEYQAHHVGPVLGGLILHPIAHGREALRFYREFTADQPDQLQTWAGILTLPDGNVVVALIPCYVGSLDEGERAIAPLRRFGSPVADTVAPISYVAMQQLFDPAFPAGRQNYWKSGLASTLADELIEATVEHAQKMPSPHTAFLFAEMHGAYSRVAKTGTAYFHRDLQYDAIILSGWTEAAETERNVNWTRELFAIWEPHLAEAAYVNDLGEEGEDRARSAYGENYPRLATLKSEYDPRNLFRQNQNIQPM
jgi:FAD binding domain/Berberine and berberine like